MLKYFIFTTICLLAWSAVSAQDREQIPEGNLPPVNEVLVQASRHIAKLEPDVTQAYLYRQLAALFARSQNLDAAYRTLKRIRISESINRQTAKNLKRIGFLEMVEDVSLNRDTQTAIKIVTDCPDEFRAYSDDAFGRIALGASKRQDSKGTWAAIAKIKKTDGLYHYELTAAITLNDKTRGKKILLRLHSKIFGSAEPGLFGEEFAVVPWLLSLYKWCELDEEFEQLLDYTCQVTRDPAGARAELLAELEEGAKAEDTESSDDTEAKVVSAEDLRSMITSANKFEDPQKKSEHLLNAARKLLEFGHPPIDK